MLCKTLTAYSLFVVRLLHLMNLNELGAPSVYLLCNKSRGNCIAIHNVSIFRLSHLSKLPWLASDSEIGINLAVISHLPRMQQRQRPIRETLQKNVEIISLWQAGVYAVTGFSKCLLTYHIRRFYAQKKVVGGSGSDSNIILWYICKCLY